jgi:phage protein D
MPRNYQPIHSPRFEVAVGGQAFSTEAEGRMSDLVVETTIDGADRVSFSLTSPFDPETNTFPDVDWNRFSTGTEVEVSLGYGGQGSLEPVFTGHVQSVKVDFSSERGPSVSVSGYGLLHRMMRGVTDRSWTDASVTDVVGEVLSPYFETTKVESSKITRNKIVQHDRSDYQFVRHLADKYGYQFYAERDTVYFTPRSSLGSGSPVATLRFGEQLDSFTAEVNEASRVKTVDVRYWDMVREEPVVGSATRSSVGNDKTEVFRIPCDSKAEADRVAQSKLDELSTARARGHGETEGNPTLAAGRTVKLAGMGDRFSRNYYVTKASHRFGDGGYRTSFEAVEIPQ